MREISKSSETSDQMETAVDKDSLAMCVVELLKDETLLKRMKEVLFQKKLDGLDRCSKQ